MVKSSLQCHLRLTLLPRVTSGPLALRGQRYVPMHTAHYHQRPRGLPGPGLLGCAILLLQGGTQGSSSWTGQCGRAALVVWPWKSWPCPSAAAALGEVPEAVLESSPCWGGFRRAGELTNSAASHARSHPNIHFICGLPSA